jgi:hypothetical protein
MAKSNRNTHAHFLANPLHHLTSVTFSNASSENLATHILQSRELSFSTSSESRPEATSFPSQRCSEKGCVFPASSPKSAKCAYHERQMEEPSLFCSQQPSRLLLDSARSMPANEEYDEGRKRDRRRLAKEWEEFQRDSSM